MNRIHIKHLLDTELFLNECVKKTAYPTKPYSTNHFFVYYPKKRHGFMYTAKNKVRMHDTDMAGILYFPNQFRFAHDTLEDFMEDEGYPFNDLFHKFNFVFVIVHCSADYKASLSVGDILTIHLAVEHVGKSSFSFFYKIYREEELVGTVKTVHVTLDQNSRKKIPIPEELRVILKKHECC